MEVQICWRKKTSPSKKKQQIKGVLHVAWSLVCSFWDINTYTYTLKNPQISNLKEMTIFENSTIDYRLFFSVFALASFQKAFVVFFLSQFRGGMGCVPSKDVSHP